MDPIRGLFITGTDTGVGKTRVACALAAWRRMRGWDTGVMKPFTTGAARKKGRWICEDAQALIAASGVADAPEDVHPVCFAEALAPLVAARRVKRRLSLGKALHAFFRLAGDHDFMIVEGAGGLLVPLTVQATIADFAKQLGLPLVIVVRPGLGTINHTLLTLAAARQAGLEVAGVVINHSTPAPKAAAALAAIRTNPQVIAEQGKVAVAGVLGFRQGPLSARLLGDWAESHLDKNWLRRWLGQPSARFAA